MSKQIKKYVVISKENVISEPHMRHHTGKNILIRFASNPTFSTFYWMKRQGHPVPNYYDKKTAEYAKKKYAPSFVVRPYEDVVKEFNAYEYGK